MLLRAFRNVACLPIAQLTATWNVGAGLAACSLAHQPVPTSSKTAAPQQVQIPDAVKVPSGNKLAGSFEGHGVQIYQCTNNSWTLLQSAAIISDNGKYGAHAYAYDQWSVDEVLDLATSFSRATGPAG